MSLQKVKPSAFVAQLLVGAASLMFVLLGCKNKQSMDSPSIEVTSYKDFVAMESQQMILGEADVDVPLVDNCDELCKSRRSEFRYVVYVGKEIYCYWQEKIQLTGINYNQLAQTLEQSITSDTTPSQYFRILRIWAASLHDGHVNVMPGDTSSLQVYSMPVGFEVLAAGTEHEKLIVASVKNVDQVARGDVVLSVDGIPTKTYLDKEALERSGSTTRGIRHTLAPRISAKVGSDIVSDALTLELAKPDGTIVKATVPREFVPTAKVASAATETTGIENFKVSILPGSVGYIRLDGFWGSQSEGLLDQTLDALASTKGLLIDMRTNGGGDQSGNRLIRRLITGNVTRYRTSERMSPFILNARPDLFVNLSWLPGSSFAEWHDLVVTPASNKAEQYLQKPVVVLTSPYCFSACDTFVSALKVNKLATVVGEGTGGGTGSPLVFELPVTAGMKFRYSVVRGMTADGQPIEGHGTLPDIELAPTVEERVAGKDLQLQKAVEILLGKINGDQNDPQSSQLAQAGAEQVLSAFEPSWAVDLSEPSFITETRKLRQMFEIDELDMQAQ